MSKAHFSSTIFPFAEQAAARERARIRRLIGPALRGIRIPLSTVRMHMGPADTNADDIQGQLDIIDAATKPEPKRKRGAK